MKYLTFGDKLVMASVMVISLVIFLAFTFGFQNPGELYVEIKSDGREYAVYPLNNFEKTIEIDNKFGYNEIKIYNGNVWVSESNCDDKIEMKDGPANKSGQVLVCLPHRLTVSIVSKKAEVDGVTY